MSYRDDWRDDFSDQDEEWRRREARGRDFREGQRADVEASRWTGRSGYGSGDEGRYRSQREFGRGGYRSDAGWTRRQQGGDFGAPPAQYGSGANPAYRGYGGDFPRSEDWGYRGRQRYGREMPGRRDFAYHEEEPAGALPYEHGEDYYRGTEHERPWMERAGDEVASWFGNEHAAERRRMDQFREHHRGRGPKGYVRSDERIREDVSDRLMDDPWVDASNIEVSVASGEVTLSGTVDSRETKRRAEDIAEDVSGVKHVQINLRVKPEDWSSSVGATAVLHREAPMSGQRGSTGGGMGTGGIAGTRGPASSTGTGRGMSATGSGPTSTETRETGSPANRGSV